MLFKILRLLKGNERFGVRIEQTERGESTQESAQERRRRGSQRYGRIYFEFHHRNEIGRERKSDKLKPRYCFKDVFNNNAYSN